MAPPLYLLNLQPFERKSMFKNLDHRILWNPPLPVLCPVTVADQVGTTSIAATVGATTTE